MSITFLFRLLATLLGLTIPGYALGRALRLKDNLATAFPFSALIICQTVVLLTCLGWRISFELVSAILVALSFMFAGIAYLAGKNEPEPPERASNEISYTPLFNKTCLFLAYILLAAVAIRTICYPLGGFDTYARWDALARAMLKHASLTYYPPLITADFKIYILPDGFPPLIASIYWWIYAASGSINPQLTSISVTLQLLATMALTYRAACHRFGAVAARFTLLSLTASPLLISSFEIGQESGFLALAVAGQLCFAFIATDRQSVKAVIAAALFAALGAQAREYGPALAMPGLLIILFDPKTRHLTWKYILFAAAFSSPWYIRNLLITGNPLYSHALPGGFPVNKGLLALLKYYQEIYSPLKFGNAQWFSVLYETVTGMTIAAAFGLPSLLSRYRSNIYLLASTAIIVGLWIWSIGSTCGGVIYSMRVLAPAIILLSVATGVFARDVLATGTFLQQRSLKACFIACSLYGIFSAIAYPAPVAEIASSFAITKSEQPESTPADLEFISQIKQLNIPPTGIFTDSAYLAQKLLNETKFRPVMPWYPEVAFLFNPEMTGEEMQQIFISLDIHLVAIRRDSLNSAFLYRMPLFRDTFNNWSLKLVTYDEWALFSLTESKQTSDN